MKLFRFTWKTKEQGSCASWPTSKNNKETSKVLSTFCEIHPPTYLLLPGATMLMQELQVDSYLTMPTEEKVDFMLEQLRLVYQQENYALAETISNKIVPSKFADNFVCTLYT